MSDSPPPSDPRIAIAGGSGFVGTHLIHHLCSQYRPRALTAEPPGPSIQTLMNTPTLLALAVLTGLASAQTLDPAQANYVDKYKKQPNPPKPAEMLINTEKEL